MLAWILRSFFSLVILMISEESAGSSTFYVLSKLYILHLLLLLNIFDGFWLTARIKLQQ
jgi:hypothetical protein